MKDVISQAIELCASRGINPATMLATIASRMEPKELVMILELIIEQSESFALLEDDDDSLERLARCTDKMKSERPQQKVRDES